MCVFRFLDLLRAETSSPNCGTPRGRIILALESEESDPKMKVADMTEEDQWIMARIDSSIRQTEQALHRYDFGTMAKCLYRLSWDDFASWALELAKPRFQANDVAIRRGALATMGTALMNLLRLLHPITPFVTEELWSRLIPLMQKHALFRGEAPQSKLLIQADWPQPKNPPQPELEQRFSILKRFVNAVRRLRSVSQIKDNARIEVEVKALHPDTQRMLNQAEEAVCFLGRMENIRFVEQRRKGDVGRI